MCVFYPRKQVVVNAKKLPNLKVPLDWAGQKMGENMKKFLIIFAMMLMPVFAHGACSTSSTYLSAFSGYTQKTTNYGQMNSIGHCGTNGMTSKYVYDSTAKVYMQLYSCVDCVNGAGPGDSDYYPMYTYEEITVGSCTFEYVVCKYCNQSGDTPEFNVAGTLGSASNCVDAYSYYFGSRQANSSWLVHSCNNGCDAGYSQEWVESSVGNCDVGFYTCSAIICSGGQYLSGNECIDCPDVTKTYTDSALTTKPNAVGGGGQNPITKCFIVSGPTYYDASGSFNLQSSCYYSTSSSGDVL